MTRKSSFLFLALALIAPFLFSYSAKAVPTSKKPPREKAMVYSVTDGDTVKVKINGKKFTVRLIGTDTPEIKDPRKTVQCFGREASAYTKKNLLNKNVILEADVVAGNKDKYGRILRYVFLENGVNFNRQLIADGYAYEYTYKSQLYRYRDKFKQAQKEARENKRGLWADDACAGKSKSVI